MITRRRLAVGLGGGVLAVALVWIVASRPRGPFFERYDRIRRGMTFEEAATVMEPYEAIMADYKGQSHDWASTTVFCWEGDGGRIAEVQFEDSSLRVVRKAMYGPPCSLDYKLRLLLDRLGF